MVDIVEKAGRRPMPARMDSPGFALRAKAEDFAGAADIVNEKHRTSGSAMIAASIRPRPQRSEG